MKKMNGWHILKKMAALLLLCSMMLASAPGSRDAGVFAVPKMASAAAETKTAAQSGTNDLDGSKTNDLDGSKIEGIQVSWVTEDSAVTADEEPAPSSAADPSRLFLSTTGNSEIAMNYLIEVQFSGQYDYQPGDITITIPAQVFPTRVYDQDQVGQESADERQGMLELPVPEAPSTKADFNWQLVGDQYVLTNTRKIGATSSVSIEVAIRGIKPMQVVDRTVSDPIFAHCEVITNQGNVIELTSNRIDAQIDTEAHVVSALKGGELIDDLALVPPEMLNNLPAGANPADYVYAKWYTYHSHKNNQPYSLDIEDVLLTAYKKMEDGTTQNISKGIFLGSSNYEGTIYPAADISFTAAIDKNLMDISTANQYDKTVYMWSAYKKSDFPLTKENEPAREYHFDNEVTWIVTETDRAVEDDPQKVTRQPAKASLMFAPTEWKRPTGSFIVHKWTEEQPEKDWNYGLGLNLLERDEEVDMKFLVQTIAFGYGFTSPYSAPDAGPAGSDDELQASYGTLGWKAVTEDFQTFFNFDREPLTAEDFEFKSLYITAPATMRYQKMPDGSYGYRQDTEMEIPDLVVEYQQDGQWKLACRVLQEPQFGLSRISFEDVAAGVRTVASEHMVYFPENTTDVRWTYTSNVTNGKTIEQCKLAAVLWDVYPYITLKPSDRVKAHVRELFDEADNPTTKFQNDVKMNVYGWVDKNGNGSQVVKDDFDSSRATVAGAGYGVSLVKEGEYSADAENRRTLIHYTATLTEQSLLGTMEEYREAVDMNIIPAETSGIWYDLLPEHVIPMVDSVKLRSGDTVKNAYAIENFRGTGRYLLVVEADMTPEPQNIDGGDFFDRAVLEFDAAYSWYDMEKYGTELVNYVAFESTVEDLRNDTLGSITGKKGEPDTPIGGNNNTTPAFPADIVKALTDLDPNTDESRFVYGMADHHVSALTYAVSGLEKSVRNDLEGVWTQGLEDQEQVTVYEGHRYTYQLRISSAEDTSTKGIVIYDTLENYHIPDPSAEQDTDSTKAQDYYHTQDRKDWAGAWQGKGQWRGTLVKVDLSQFVEAGVKPVLLYSEIADLQFAETKSEATDGNFDEDTAILSSGNYDISNRNIWKVAQLDEKGIWTVPAGVNVSAIAIDATTTATGREFILAPEEALSAFLHMRAPDDNGDPDVWNAKGAYARKADGTVDWDAAMDKENNMYAFNNTRVRLIQGNTVSGQTVWLSNYRMIRNDYTRVGILPSVVEVSKEWQDQENHDAIRTESVTVSVMRKVAGAAGAAQPLLDADGNPVQLVLSEENNWMQKLLQVDVVNEDGVPYLYSFVEEQIPGYECINEYVTAGVYKVKNIHPNETVEFAGRKTWADNGNEAGARPEEVTVNLYRDEVLYKTLQIKDNGTDSWEYSFGPVDKYEAGGREYVYRIEEKYVPKYGSEIDEENNITNTYIPYGDLLVGKTVEGATSAANGQEFSFTLVLLEEKTGEDAPDKPLEGKFDGDVMNSAGEKIGSVRCGNGDTFKLQAGQTVVFRNLPSDCRYEVIEHEAPGYTSASDQAAGTVLGGGQQVEARFVNTYSAGGSAQLKVGKQLTGAAIVKNKFKFELVDRNEGSETEGQVIATTRVQKPEDEASGGLGVSVESESNVLFGALRYTHEDHGKTFLYELREVDDELGGYTSDTKTYRVEVSVTDNGDGTLTVTPTYKDASGNALSELPKFENRYDATGEVQLKVWKTLEGRALTADEFEFELYEADSTGAPAGEAIASAVNDANGNVVFDALAFTQDDVSIDPENPAVYWYLVKEKEGGDNTVTYSAQQYLFKITVHDNGDGTLSFDQEVYAVEEGSVSENQTVPVFANVLKPGALTVEKLVSDDSTGGNADQEFTFHVKLSGEAAQDMDFTVTVPEDGTIPEDPEGGSGAEGNSGFIAAPTTVNTSKQVHITDAQMEEWGPAYAVLDLRENSETKGSLIFFRSKEAIDPFGNSITANNATKRVEVGTEFIHYYIDETSGNFTAPWGNAADRKRILSITTKDYIRIKFTGMFNNMFREIPNLTSVNLSKFDTSQMTNMAYMFYMVGTIKELDLSSFDTSKVTSFLQMFQGSNTLETINVSSFDTSEATTMHYMFVSCNQLKYVQVNHFDFSKVTKASGMFDGCKELEMLDLSNIEFPAGNINGMFEELGSSGNGTWLDISKFDPANVTSMEGLFSKAKISAVTIGNKTIIPESYVPVVPTTNGYDGTWVNEDGTLRLTSKELFTEGNHAGTWRWNTAIYKLNFLPGEEGSGSMASVNPGVGSDYTFVPRFTSAMYEVSGFKDQNGKEYTLNADGTCTIPANTYPAVDGKEQEVTLTAQWKPKDLGVTVTEDGVIFKLKAGETITFNNLPASTAYEVWEELPDGWVLVSKTNDAGVIQSLETAEAVFTNKYDPTKVTVSLRAGKTLDSQPAAADAFTFTLSDDSGVVQTKKNAAGGGVVFDTITYDQAGEYTYIIQEKADGDSTIEYDETVYTVTVKVEDNGAGVLSAAVSYAKGTEVVEADDIVFMNTTKPGSLKLTKEVSGKLTDTARKQEFTFDIAFTDEAFQPWSGELAMEDSAETLTVTGGKAAVTLQGGESLTLTGIPAGIAYEVKETGSYPGWTCESEENTEGTIQPDETAECTVTNAYTAAGSAALQIEKELAGRKLKLNEFSFQLVDAEKRVIGTASNGADGVVRFDPIEYTEEGEYSYVIVEVPGTDDAVKYSSEQILVTVEVKDEAGKGVLTCTPAYQIRRSDGTTQDGAVITNTLKTGALSVAKTVESINEKHKTDETYRFNISITLTNPDGSLFSGVVYTAPDCSADSAVNVQDGILTALLRHDESITWWGIPAGVTYEVTEQAFKNFTAAYEGETGAIEENVTAEAAITNTYHAKGEIVLGCEKVLMDTDGNVLPLEEGQFTFVLLPEGDTGTFEAAVATNDAEGKAFFETFVFDENDVGKHTYLLQERNDGKAGYEYSEDVHTFVVTVTDNGDGTLNVTAPFRPEDYTFINVFIGTTDIPVEKVWQDEEDKMGLRPDSITVELYRNKEKQEATVILSDENEWKASFEDLPLYDENGAEYFYELKEVPVANYSGSVAVEDGVTVFTNTLDTQGTLVVTKTEKGNDAAIGTRAFDFTVTLTENDVPYMGTIVLEKNGQYTTLVPDNDGKITFQLRHGEKAQLLGLPYGVDYTVDETAVAGYTTTSSGDTGTVQNGILHQADFTNTYNAVGVLNLTATKTVNGETPKAEEVFSFRISGYEGVDYTVPNTGESIVFLALNYDLDDAGQTIIYTIAESKGDKPGYTYDATQYEIVVTVTDAGDGTLNVTYTVNGTENGDIAFKNEYAADGSVQFGGTKTLTGTDLQAEQFSFTLTDGDGVIETVKNDADGKFNFSEIKYTLDDVGKHTYTVTEVNDGKPGYTYDATEYEIIVTVTDAGDGTLNVTYTVNGTESGDIAFKNEYAADGSVQFMGTKTLTGTDLQTDQFSFTLTDGDGVTETVKNDADGKFSFSEIKYTLDDVGEHTYTVTEVNDGKPGYTYDATEYEIIVTVTDAGDGTLNVTYTVNDTENGDIAFKNEYAADGSVQFMGTKTLTGTDLQADQFSFTLTDGDGVIETVKNDADGKFSFSEIKYTLDDVGKQTYTVTEVNDGKPGYTYDATEYEIVVKVTDAGDGTLTVTYTVNGTEGGDIAFKNEYAADGSVQFMGTKTLTSTDLQADQFSFTLTDGDGVIETVKNDADGKFNFSEIKYTLDDVGEHTYTVTEVNDGKSGYTYDATEYEIIVTVTDAGDGTLTVTYTVNGTENGDISFKNEYAADGSVQFMGTKTLTGIDLQADQFSFTLTGDGVTETVKNDADGKFSFSEIKYTLDDVGEHNYTVTEVNDGKAGYTYDDTEYEIVVTVADAGDGTLTVTYTVNGTENGNISFKNEYAADGSVQFMGTKTLTGTDLQADQFSFTLTDGDGVIETVKNDADGKFSFSEIKYTLDDVGEHTYTVTEVNDAKPGYTYDATEYEIIVTVTDAGDGTLNVTYTVNGTDNGDIAFKNEYAADGSVQFMGTKTLTGTDLQADQFSFTLTDGDGVIETVQNDETGKFSFSKIKYTLDDVGEHTYTVTEVNDGKPGYTYDAAEYEIIVTVTDAGDGTLNVTYTVNGTESGDISFKNEYAADGSVQFGGTKTLTGTDLQADQFSFTLTDGDGVTETVKNDADGKFSFTEIKYTLDDVGEHTYTVTEVNDGKPGYTYDATEYEIVVTVADAGDGTLNVTYTVNGEENGEIVFGNAYESAGSIRIQGQKLVQGEAPEGNETFTFQLKDADGKVLQEAENQGSLIAFKEIPYTLADTGKTYVYSIVESTESDAAWQTDDSEYTLTVTLTDDGAGSMTTDWTLEKNGEAAETILFNNIPLRSLTIEKTVVGGDAEKAFAFKVTLTDENGQELDGSYPVTGADASSIASGEYLHLKNGEKAEITHLPVGTKYTVEEDEYSAYMPTVNGTEGRKAEGTITEDGAAVTFVNTEKTVSFSVTKEWQGDIGDAIILTLYGNGEKLNPQPSYNKDGDVYSYNNLPQYDAEGKAIVYSAKEKYMDGFMTIYRNKAPYTEETSWIYNGGTVINRAVTEFRVKKVWEGLAEGEEIPEITLTLYCNGEAMDKKTPKPDEDGWYVWYNLPITKNGEAARYSVVEEPVDGFTVTYGDDAEATCAYNGDTIVNHKIPKTGDDSHIGLWLVVTAVSAAGCILLLKKRREAK